MKVTEWFPASVKPVRVGWYQCRGIFYDGTTVMRYWSGAGWQWRDTSGQMSRAAVCKSCDKHGIIKEDRWRGLTAPAEQEARKP